MKKSVTAIMLSLSLGLLGAPLAHAGKRDAQAYVDSYAGRTDIPVPLTVVSPVLDHEHAGTLIEVTFIVDRDGRPVGIAADTQADHDLVLKVTRAIAQWRFAPARDNHGQPVARKVVLPVRIVGTERDGRYALR